jgi:hypothetical protein
LLGGALVAVQGPQGRWPGQLLPLLGYRSDRLEVLLIGESPPDPGGGNRRFFYALPSRSTTSTAASPKPYGHHPEVDLADKPAVLGRLQADGFWLIDAVDRPGNYLPPGPGGLPSPPPCRSWWPAAMPGTRRGVIICHRVVYQLTTPSMREAGVRVLHDEPLPFPLGNWRPNFIARLRRALT